MYLYIDKLTIKNLGTYTFASGIFVCYLVDKIYDKWILGTFKGNNL